MAKLRNTTQRRSELAENLDPETLLPLRLCVVHPYSLDHDFVTTVFWLTWRRDINAKIKGSRNANYSRDAVLNRTAGWNRTSDRRSRCAGISDALRFARGEGECPISGR